MARKQPDSNDVSRELLVAVLDGATYAAAGGRHGMGKTGCEKRIKQLIACVHHVVGIDGLDEGVPLSAAGLRGQRDQILKALEQYDPNEDDHRPNRPLSPELLRSAAARIRESSDSANRDVALLYTLFITGAKPIEIARFQVRDYLDAFGLVREVSEVRPEAAINGRARPLYFRTHRARDAIDTYLTERVRRKQGLGSAGAYRGLDPCSSLFLKDDGQPFKVSQLATDTKGRFHCRGILDAYRSLFVRAGLHGVTTQSARREVARRLRERGADDDQIGELLGIKDLGALRHLIASMRRPLGHVVENLL